MNSREKLMALAVGLVIVLFGLKAGYDYISDSFAERERTLADTQKKLDVRQAKIDAGRRAQKQISDWNKRSLPTDPSASSAYLSWLGNTAKDLGSQAVEQTGSARRVMDDKTGFEVLKFKVKGESEVTLKQLVKFLYEFYASNQLHKIRQMAITPHADRKLTVVIDIDALVLRGSDRANELSKERIPQLSRGDLAAYESKISGRNFFTEYREPQRPPDGGRRPPASTFDVAKHTYLTAIVSQNDQPGINIIVRPTSDKFELKEGDEFEVGGVTYQVLQINVRDREAILKAGGKRKQIHLGDTLNDAVPLPDEEGGL
jgi:hypothetical protein